MTELSYIDFLKTKFQFSRSYGFDVEDIEINPLLKPAQRDVVRWAIKKGRAALFEAFGMGKTMQQLEILRLIMCHEGGSRHLITAPLGVRQEFKHDCYVLATGDSPNITDAQREELRAWQEGRPERVPFIEFIRRSEDVQADGLYLSNYESVRDGKLDVNLFTSVSLDEASVLRSYGSKTYQEFLTLFGQIKYKFVATATPSPNRYKELIHYAGFLGIMDTGQALTRFFQRDSTQANNLTLHPHMEAEFFLWLHSWAIFLQKPSDLGYDDTGYDLPDMTVHYHEVPVPDLTGKIERDGQTQLIRDNAMGLKEAASEKRESIEARVQKMMEIIGAAPDDHFILWHDLEAERHAIKAALPEVTEVYGSLDTDENERRVVEFAEGRAKYLAAKPMMYGSGPNWQYHCHKAIFVGIGYKFNDFIQAIKRIHRFQQGKPVEIHIIYMETERDILKDLQDKWANDDRLRDQMSELIRKFGLATTGLEQQLARSIGIERKETLGRLFQAANNDCVDECKNHMEENSVDLICTSIPFGNHYEYSASYNDFGHNEDNEKFFGQMDFLTPELLRILKPGRIAAIHVKDRIRFGNVTGYGMPSVEPFHSDCIVHYRKHGFIYMGMITVVTDVVRENNQTYRLGWSEQCKDGTKMGVGSPEYILLFRKLPTDTSRAYADEPVVKTKAEYTRAQWQIDAHAFWRSDGNRFLTADELAGIGPDAMARIFTQRTLETVYNYHQHVIVGKTLESENRLPATFMSIAPGSHHPEVWHDVNRMRTLNGNQTQRKLKNHICPLQFDIVDRLINRYSNKGELVFDPFGGLGTVAYRAIKLGRTGRCVDLDLDSYNDSLFYLRLAEMEAEAPSLFDLEELGQESTELELAAA